jgi:hypothetical protein
MCDRCIEIDKRITHFRDMARAVGDLQTVRSIVILVAELQGRKVALHSECQE